MARLRTCSCWCAINCATVNGYKSANLHHKEVLGIRIFSGVKWQTFRKGGWGTVCYPWSIGPGWSLSSSDLEVLLVDGLDGRHPDRWRCVRPLLSFVSGLPHTLSHYHYHSLFTTVGIHCLCQCPTPFSLIRIPG